LKSHGFVKSIPFLTLLLTVSASLASDISTETVQSAIRRNLGFENAIRVEITGVNPKNQKACSLVANLENGDLAIYDDTDDDDNGLSFRSLSPEKQNIVDVLREEDGALYLHSKKDAGKDIGKADFEFTITAEKVATVKVAATLMGIFKFGGNPKKERSCLLQSEPRSVPTFKSIWNRFKKKPL
jgi:hypothetical protein